MSGRTTFVIGHRLSTISLADSVILIDQGRVVDQGSIDELTARSALFRDLTGGAGEDPLFVPEDEEVLA
jgi:ATP-binding cassette subfamily B protein